MKRETPREFLQRREREKRDGLQGLITEICVKRKQVVPAKKGK